MKTWKGWTIVKVKDLLEILNSIPEDYNVVLRSDAYYGENTVRISDKIEVDTKEKEVIIKRG